MDKFLENYKLTKANTISIKFVFKKSYPKKCPGSGFTRFFQAFKEKEHFPTQTSI